jgi:hypothetical protein
MQQTVTSEKSQPPKTNNDRGIKMKRVVALHTFVLLAAVAFQCFKPAWAQTGTGLSRTFLTAPPSAVGESVQLSASAGPGFDIGFLPPPFGGTVSFTRGTGEPLPGCTDVPLNSVSYYNLAVCAVTGEGIGLHSYKATYSGSAIYAGSVSNLLVHRVTGNRPATVVAASFPERGVPGQPFAVDVSLSAAGKRPTGTVSFSSPPYPIPGFDVPPESFADVPGCVNVPLVDGVAECLTSRDIAGRHNYRVTYSGDDTYRAGVAGLFVPVGNAPHRHDLTGDGYSDVVWYHTGFHGLRTTRNVYATLDYALPLDMLASADWQVAGVADLDGDTRADIVTRNASTGEVSVQFAAGLSGLPKVTIYTEPNLDWKIEQLVDLDGDGRAEIVWRNQTSGDVYAMRLEGSAVSGGQTIYSEPNLDWKIVASGDLNGDGMGDLLWRNAVTGDVYLMLLNGQGEGTSPVIGGGMIYAEPNLDWTIAGVGDFNRDGRSDILWRNTVTGAVFQIQMGEDMGILATQLIDTGLDTQWQIAGLGDYDRDGAADMLWRNAVTGEVLLMRMLGFTMLSSSVLYVEPDPQWQIIGP